MELSTGPDTDGLTTHRTSTRTGMIADRPLLTDEMLQRFQQRSPEYDRENRFFSEDFEELRDAGYLTMAVPRELGGRGYTMAEVCREQRRLGYYAPSDALAINMHIYWTGVAADLWRRGDRSLEWLLQEAANGAVFAAGHAEAGNDVPLLLSTTRAERVDGGYRFYGHKMFGSLTPVWTMLGLHGLDTSDPAAPKVVHAFMPRDTEGYSVKETWDVMGMRATKSDDTVLDGAFVPDRYIARVVPAGAAGLDAFVLSTFAWALLGFGNIYFGMAQRARDLIVESVRKKTSMALSRPMAYHAGVQHGIAEIVLDLESIEPHLDRVAQDWSAGVDHGVAWVIKIVAAKYHAVEGAWRVVDRAFDLAGGLGIFRKAPFEQLLRDARLGRIHPANSMLTHELCAKLTLGISPDETPRWG
jgi:alkylation response protein AidB-like acyl-CoA dehydrogenase